MCAKLVYWHRHTQPDVDRHRQTDRHRHIQRDRDMFSIAMHFLVANLTLVLRDVMDIFVMEKPRNDCSLLAARMS